MKWISGILAIAALFGLLWKMDGYVAHADDLRLVEMRLDQKIDKDRANALEERNWSIKQEYKGKPMPPVINREIKKNEVEINDIRGKWTPGGK